jgi:hypothetical protein
MEIGKFTGDRTWRCPDETRLAAFVEQRLAAPERARLEAHIADCDYCLGQVGALERLQDAVLPDDVPPRILVVARELVAGRARAAKPWWYWGSAAAATACLAIAITFEVWQPQAGLIAHPQTVRGTADQSTAIPELLLPRESAMVPRAALEFRWNRVERTLFYEVRVVTADGDLIWEARADHAEARVPPNVLLVNGERYYVSVSAWLPDGKTVKAPPVGFQVTGQ